MKIFGVSVTLILLVVAAYFIGAKFPATANKVLSVVP